MAGRKLGEPYQCPKCKAVYLHDQGYWHEAFDCPKRKGAGHGRSVKGRLG